jgi:DNA-binding transcriptional ArsR family regulator
MTAGALDPQIHHPDRLRIIATLAALPDGDTLSVSRLQQMLRLPSGGLSIGVQELGEAGYVRTIRAARRSAGDTAGDGTPTAIALTADGRVALARYTDALSARPWAERQDHRPPAPHLRAGDADRDATAAALGEHFAQGRLTLDELRTRLEATLTALTHGDLSEVSRDLPDLTVLSAWRTRHSKNGQPRDT